MASINTPITNPRNNTPGVLFGDRVFAKSIQVGQRSDVIRVYSGWNTWTPSIISGVASIDSSTGTLYRQVGDEVELILNLTVTKDTTDTSIVLGNLPIAAFGNTGMSYANKLLLKGIDTPGNISATVYIDNPPLNVFNIKSLANLTDTEQYLVNGQFSYKASSVAS